jgi:hypothetical protein
MIKIEYLCLGMRRQELPVAFSATGLPGPLGVRKVRFDAFNLCGKTSQELCFAIFRGGAQINGMLPVTFRVIKN